MVSDLLPRMAAERVRSALADTPVVVVQGPRQAGKSTLIRDLLGDLHRYVTLDDLDVLAAARRDPQGFIDGLPSQGVAIDEVQRAPDLTLAIKASVDRDRRPGRFVLTGSADVFSRSGSRESLAGRTEVIPLWPLAQSELASTPAFSPARLFHSDVNLTNLPPVEAADLWHRVQRGGYPEAAARTAHRRDAWLDAYVQEVIRFEIAELSAIEGLLEIPRLLRLLATATAGLLNYSHLARDLGVSPRTSTRYLSLLVDTYLVQLVPAWTRSQRKRLVKSPKALVADSGLAWYLAGLDQPEGDHRVGRHLEAFVLAEFRRLLDAHVGSPALYHFQTSGQREVDAVLEHRDGRVVGIEVKAARTVRASDFNGLRTLAEVAGDDFHLGIVLHCGTQAVQHGEGLWTLPLSLLWTAV